MGRNRFFILDLENDKYGDDKDKDNKVDTGNEYKVDIDIDHQGNNDKDMMAQNVEKRRDTKQSEG